MNSKSSPKRTLGYLTGIVAHALAWQLRRNFEAEGLDLSHAQMGLLSDLYLEDGLTQQQLSRRIWKDKAAIKRTVDLLEAKGYVTRTPGDDSRCHRICLTPLAREMKNDLRRISEKTQREATADIDPEELAIFVKVLEQIHARFTTMTPEE